MHLMVCVHISGFVDNHPSDSTLITLSFYYNVEAIKSMS